MDKPLKVYPRDNSDTKNSNNRKQSNNFSKPGEKFEFPLLMHEINVLPVELSWLFRY
jgi:hypothetical protein